MSYGPIRSFTSRQEQVIDAIRRDLSNREIAAALGISESTVQGHINTIMYALRNPDDLSDRMCIFQFGWWRIWHEQVAAREELLREIEDAQRPDVAKRDP